MWVRFGIVACVGSSCSDDSRQNAPALIPQIPNFKIAAYVAGCYTRVEGSTRLQDYLLESSDYTMNDNLTLTQQKAAIPYC